MQRSTAIGADPRAPSGRFWSPKRVALAALAPTALVTLVCFYGFSAWTIVVSLTRSRLLPRYDFAGLSNYDELGGDDRFAAGYLHLLGFGVPFVLLALALGIGLAVCVDRLGAARCAAVFVSPLAVSWLVTGVVWQWILNPGFGIERTVRAWGLPWFRFDPLGHPTTALLGLAGASAWHMAGLVMAILLVGMRGISPDIWNAARAEGVPIRRIYRHIILPMLWPYVATCIALLAFAAIRTFDLAVALTGGGPGFATDLPTQHVYDYMFARGRLGIGAASAVALMLTAVAALAPYLALQSRQRR